jgi:transcriptional regulator with XRE-family HTH domain
MKLKELRSRIGLTQKQLADEMDTTQQTIARWETGKTVLNVDQIRDLCVVLGCTADELLGWEAEPSEIRTSPFSSIGSEEPFGTLRIGMTCCEREYPIGMKARKSLLERLETLDPINASNKSAWLETSSLDNKLLLINLRYLRKLRLLSDDVEEMPDFENPEIYRALDDFPRSTATGQARKKCEELVALLGGEDEANRLVAQVRVTYDDGSDDWSHLSEETASEWFGVSMALPHLEQTCFVQIDEDGAYDSSFANLDRVAVIEIPADRFLRLIADDGS